MKNLERGRRYTLADDFFTLNGSVNMKLTAEAAISVCKQAVWHGLVVIRIEGGIWHLPRATGDSPKFEARLDCIWDGVDPPVDVNVAKKNNDAAAEFIRSESLIHDAFIITTQRLTCQPKPPIIIQRP